MKNKRKCSLVASMSKTLNGMTSFYMADRWRWESVGTTFWPGGLKIIVISTSGRHTYPQQPFYVKHKKINKKHKKVQLPVLF